MTSCTKSVGLLMGEDLLARWVGMGRAWRCVECLAPLEVVEIWQDSKTGEAYCAGCWLISEDELELQSPPNLCGACNAPFKPIPNQNYLGGWSGSMPAASPVCEACAKPLTDDEVREAVDGFLQLLEDTDEDQDG